MGDEREERDERAPLVQETQSLVVWEVRWQACCVEQGDSVLLASLCKKDSLRPPKALDWLDCIYHVF